MKDTLKTIIIATLLILAGFMLSQLEPVICQKIFKKMTLEEFLQDKNPNRWNEVYLNKDKNVEYKGMVIIRDDDHRAINNESAYYDDELIIYFRANGIRPEKWGCDQSDTLKNGTLGCYINKPVEK